MFSFRAMVQNIRHADTGRSLKSSLWHMGLRYPANVTGMYINRETSDYIIAAALAIMQSGD